MSDWTSDVVKSAIRDTGLSCVGLSIKHGFAAGAVAKALMQPWPTVEAIIGEHLGVSPATIWPSRYDAEGRPLAGGWAYPNRRTGALHRQNGAAA